MTTGATIPAASACLLLISSCSLMGLDEIQPQRCTNDEDCEYAQRAFPDPSRCRNYECRAGLCVLPSMQESCDRIDNDCDGWIDDDVELVGGQSVAESVTTPSALASATNGSAAFVVIGGKTGSGWRLTDEGGERLEAGTSLRYASASPLEEKPCMSEKGPMACDFSHVALAAASEHLIYATVSADGCAEGLLRVGVSRIDGEPFTIRLGKSPDAITREESNIPFGVDVADACTGKSVGRSGARSPAVAALDGAGTTSALVTWLYSPLALKHDLKACMPREMSVVGALGVFVPEGQSDWITGTDDGAPTHLGESSSLSPPALVTLSGDEPSYLVAFASSKKGQEGLHLSLVSADSSELEVSELPFFESAEADRVTMALGRERDSGVKVGVAWTTGCGADQLLHFATLGDPRTGEVALRTHWQTSVPELTGSPSLLFEPWGFASAPRIQGGWSLLWLESAAGGSELKILRLPESWLSEPVAAPPKPITLRPGSSGAPVVYPGSQAELRYALAQIDSAGRANLETIGGFCDVRE